MLKKRTVITIGSVALIGLMILIFMFISQSSKTESVAQGNEKILMSASWSRNYEDIEELTEASDLIALIEVEDEVSESVKDNIPYTNFKLKIIDSIYGSKDNSKIEVTMTGGSIGDTEYEIDDDPLINKGEQYLIFARENADGTYTIIGGSQGRLVYEDGKVNSLQVVNEQVAEANNFMNIEIIDEEFDAIVDEIVDIIE